jgi:hypothetical protein
MTAKVSRHRVRCGVRWWSGREFSYTVGRVADPELDRIIAGAVDALPQTDGDFGGPGWDYEHRCFDIPPGVFWKFRRRLADQGIELTGGGPEWHDTLTVATARQRRKRRCEEQ